MTEKGSKNNCFLVYFLPLAPIFRMPPFLGDFYSFPMPTHMGSVTTNLTFFYSFMLSAERVYEDVKRLFRLDPVRAEVNKDVVEVATVERGHATVGKSAKGKSNCLFFFHFWNRLRPVSSPCALVPNHVPRLQEHLVPLLVPVHDLKRPRLVNVLLKKYISSFACFFFFF